MDKDKAKQIANETLKIINDGYYYLNGEKYTLERTLLSKELSGIIFPENNFIQRQRYIKPINVEVINTTTLAAAKNIPNTLVLNFASATNPGGGFLKGSLAQEEYLCRNTTLYNLLLQYPLYHSYHREQNNPMYSSMMIYSPEVFVIRDDYNNLVLPWICNILTVAAPLASSIYDKKSIEKPFRERIFRVIEFANTILYDNLVLGAWGCGAFKNDPVFVAKTFNEAIKKYPYFDKIIFAILDSSEDEKYIGPFKKEFVRKL